MARRMWHRLAAAEHVCLRSTLCNGQCFGWREGAAAALAPAAKAATRGGVSGAHAYTGVIGAAVVSLREVQVEATEASFGCKASARNRGSRTSAPASLQARGVRSGSGSSASVRSGAGAGTGSGGPGAGAGAGAGPGAGPGAGASPGAMVTPSQGCATDVEFLVHNEGAPGADRESVRRSLRDYFQLDVSMQGLVKQWSSDDARMAAIARSIPGMRILRQDPTECLISFICSSNNHISRITQMLGRLRQRFGQRLATVGGDTFHAFPSVDELTCVREQQLREMGFGYRARFVCETAAALKALGGDAWLAGLRARTDPAAVQEALLQFTGVGRKVADCVAVFALDQAGAVPVDTHVWNIACRHLDPTLKEAKSLTPKVYARVGEVFRAKYGAHAGWAHSVLFAAELPMFAAQLPPDLLAETEACRREERLAKKAATAAKRQRKAAAAAAAATDATAPEAVASSTTRVVQPPPAETPTRRKRRRRA